MFLVSRGTTFIFHARCTHPIAPTTAPTDTHNGEQIWKHGEIALVNATNGTYEVEFDDGGWESNVVPERIKVTEDGGWRHRLEKDYRVLSLYVGGSGSGSRSGGGSGSGRDGDGGGDGRGGREQESTDGTKEEEEEEEGGLLVQYDLSLSPKKSNKSPALTIDDYDPSNW